MTQASPIDLTSDLAAAVAKASAWRGMTPARYVHEVLSTATRLDAELAADIKEGEDDIAAGRFYTQAEMESMFNVQRERRRAA